MVAAASTAASGLVVNHSQPNEAAPSARPKISADRTGNCWRTSGLALVRFITASMSASTTQLSAFALPAAIAPPASVASTSHGSGSAAPAGPTVVRYASSIAGTVVISNSSITRGFVNARYARHSGRGRARAGAPSTPDPRPQG